MAVQAQVFYSGRVQGVGFRATCRRLAAGFAVRGGVRNLADGRVELIAAGERAEVERFLAAVAQAMAANVERAEISWSAARQAAGAFAILG